LIRLDTSAANQRLKRWVDRTIQVAAWTGMLTVAVLMLIPVIREGRSFRPFGQRGSMTGVYRWYGNGNERDFRGEFRGAEEAFRQAIANRPNNPLAYNMLAYSLADQKKLKEALVASEKAMSLARDNGMIIDTVAEMHQRLGEFELAACLYEEALAHE